MYGRLAFVECGWFHAPKGACTILASCLAPLIDYIEGCAPSQLVMSLASAHAVSGFHIHALTYLQAMLVKVF
jgi:hypothetical protein